MSGLETTLQSLGASERERFLALAPYAQTAQITDADRDWLNTLAQQHPSIAEELRYQASLGQWVKNQAQWAEVPNDIGWARAQAQIRALPKRPARTPSATPGWRGWLNWLQPSPAWAVAAAVMLLPASFMLGRESAHAPYSDIRSVGPGLFDGPLLRVSFKPETSEQALRDVMIEQGAVSVGPTRLGDWYLKVAPERVPAVKAALAQQASVATVDVVPSLPTELVDQP
jgi:hypothetical protein